MFDLVTRTANNATFRYSWRWCPRWVADVRALLLAGADKVSLILPQADPDVPLHVCRSVLAVNVS